MGGPGILVSLGMVPRAVYVWPVYTHGPTGNDHHRHRKIMNPAFSAAHLRTFLPLFQRIGAKASNVHRPCLEVY